MFLVYCMGERAALLFYEIILTTSAIAQPDLGCKVFDARVFVVPVFALSWHIRIESSDGRGCTCWIN